MENICVLKLKKKLMHFIKVLYFCDSLLRTEMAWFAK